MRGRLSFIKGCIASFHTFQFSCKSIASYLGEYHVFEADCKACSFNNVISCFNECSVFQIQVTGYKVVAKGRFFEGASIRRVYHIQQYIDVFWYIQVWVRCIQRYLDIPWYSITYPYPQHIFFVKRVHQFWRDTAAGAPPGYVTTEGGKKTRRFFGKKRGEKKGLHSQKWDIYLFQPSNIGLNQPNL